MSPEQQIKELLEQLTKVCFEAGREEILTTARALHARRIALESEILTLFAEAGKDTADAALLDITLDALSTCESLLSLYFYRGGDEMFRQVGLPDKEQVWDAISRARHMLKACGHYEKKMKEHLAKEGK